MREETITRKLYTFDELSDEAKEKAIERLADINVDFEWWDYIYEDAERIGLKLTSFDLDRYRGAKGKFIQSAYDVANLIIKEHGSDCETTKTAKDYLIEYEKIEKGTPEDEDLETEEIDEEFLKSLLEDYGIMLQKEYEYLTSKEAIIETIEANEYEFTEDGKLA